MTPIPVLRYLVAVSAVAQLGIMTAPASAASPILSFESAADLQGIRSGNAVVTESSEHATDGKQCLRIEFRGGANPNVEIPLLQGAPQTSIAALALDLYNPASASLRVSVKLKPADPTAPVTETFISVKPGSTSFVIDLLAPSSPLPGVSGHVFEPGPSVHAHPASAPSGLAGLSSVVIGSDPWSPNATVYLDRLQIIAPGEPYSPAAALSGIVDRYGQSSYADWPGKLRNDGDFATRKRAEDDDLRANRAIADRDRFGGWAGGPLLPHTAFFTTAKYGDKWALVDPDGHLFLSLGVDCVGNSVSTVVSGRQPLFEWLPAESDAAFGSILQKRVGPNGASTQTVDLLRSNLIRKFGPDWLVPWRAESQRRLASWGFNTIGNWSHTGFYGHSLVPYTALFTVKGDHAMLHNLPDPWDPRYASQAADAARELAAVVKDDPWCLGYFVDNEMWWKGIVGWTLQSDAATSPAKRAFAALLQNKYLSIDDLNKAWGTAYESWSDFGKPHNPPTATPDNSVSADFSAFRSAHADKYFATLAAAIRSADPNHLYLGCRFAESTPEAVSACAKACDVVSFNVYTRRIDTAEWDRVLKEIDKPALVGEFHFGALDRGLLREGMVSVGSQAGRAKSFEEYVGDIARNPRFVGCHWFCFYDEPLLGRPSDGENYNIGLVDITDTPYPEMIAAARKTLPGVYAQRWSTPPIASAH
jgi:hypothetical protein